MTFVLKGGVIMATVVNNPAPAQTDGDSGSGFLLGVVLLIVFALVVIFYGLPYLSNSVTPPSTPQVQVPEKIDVNVNQK